MMSLLHYFRRWISTLEGAGLVAANKDVEARMCSKVTEDANKELEAGIGSKETEAANKVVERRQQYLEKGSDIRHRDNKSHNVDYSHLAF